ncbi:MAG: phosphoribosylanthranilate isomerase [Saprospiraceae bacterium]|nr:phosphoribosylanthranilate isomerase [Saprospiraceae bacterium]
MKPDHLIKVCGMRQPENIQAVIDAGADWMGFIFYPKSPRFMDNSSFIKSITTVKKVGVFVNESASFVQDVVEEYGLDMVQLHGEEALQVVDSISTFVEVMKAFRIKTAQDFELVDAYVPFCNYFLFDTKSELGHGGTGQQFDWSLLQNYTAETPFLLSGGIRLTDVDRLKNIEHPALIGFDINSGFEIEPALKDVEQIKQFINHLKQN